MKTTRNEINKLIKNILTEGRDPEGLIKKMKDMNITFEILPTSSIFEVIAIAEIEKKAKKGIVKKKIEIGSIYGPILDGKVWPIRETSVTGDFRKKGIGAMMYNITLAFVSTNGKYFSADPGSVSEDARRIWIEWMKQPEIYEWIQLDDKPGKVPKNKKFQDHFLTKDKDDDLNYQTIKKDLKLKNKRGQPEKYYWEDDNYKKKFTDSPIIKEYKNKNPKKFLEACKKAGILALK